jgi:hypothetical protein
MIASSSTSFRAVDPIVEPLDIRVSVLVGSTPGRDGHSGALL